MSFLQNILFLALTLSLSWFVTFAVARILHRRDPGPVLSLNRECDSGIVAGLRDLLRAQPTECEPGVFQSRPSIGMRVIAPLCALLFLALTDMTPVLNATGVEALGLGTIVKTVICLGFGYLWYMLLFQQRLDVYKTSQLVLHLVSGGLRSVPCLRFCSGISWHL